ncbi:MAG: hypothetical protein ACI8QC_003460 [Planctomycetota bacterium]|jgi:hypothetical protein
MKLSTTHAAVALVALLPWAARFSAPQDGASQDPEPSVEVDLYGRPASKAGANIARRMRGCWRLVELDNPDWPTTGRDLLGFLLVADGFLSFEVQAFWENRTGNVPDAYQTFTAQFVADKTGKVRTQSLVGSYLDREEGTLEWENPGMPREFEASMPTDSRLEIIWGDNNRMAFERIRKVGPSAASFYGRPSKGLQGERDIFGREKTDEDENENEDK